MTLGDFGVRPASAARHGVRGLRRLGEAAAQGARSGYLSFSNSVPERKPTISAAPLTIMWFRQDLRLRDNPALCAAAAGGPVLPLYILDEVQAGTWKMGGASRWWLHHSLVQLNHGLGQGLWVLSGDAEAELTRLCTALPVAKVVWNRCYEPWRIKRDSRIKRTLRNRGIDTESYNASLLREPWETVKADGSPYEVFTPFYRNLSRLMSADALSQVPPHLTSTDALSQAPLNLTLAECGQADDRIDALGLLPKVPWDTQLRATWTPGEQGAQERLEHFLSNVLDDYANTRNFPALDGVSALSAHLHFGEISPLRIWREAQMTSFGQDADPWLRQLCWREFSYHLMYHRPHMCETNLKPSFKRFPWDKNPELLHRWQQGITGYPLVDAGMRELWRTGTMHNRVRMVTASFLTKNLRIHWLTGARWFWDCLVDADLANNSFGWQWVAGCGADAAPYFRIFNPVLQSRKFDPEGDYLRRWLPELSRLPKRHIHAPWEADTGDLRKAGVVLNENYPGRVVDLQASRQKALAAWQALGT